MGQGRQYLSIPSAHAGPATDCTHTMMNPPITLGAKAPGGIQYYKLIRYWAKPLILVKSCCPPKWLLLLRVRVLLVTHCTIQFCHPPPAELFWPS